MGGPTLADFLDERAAARPDAVALVDRDRPVAWRMLAEEAAGLARGLASIGVRRGDRVALWLPDVPAWLATFFACARLGAIAVAVNTRFRSREVEDVIGRAGCRAIVCWPGFRGIDFAGMLGECDPAAFELLTHVIAYDEPALAAPAGGREAPGAQRGTSADKLPERVLGKPVLAYCDLARRVPMLDAEGRPESGCVIFTTSGTTQAPKFVLHDQRTVLRHAHDVARGFGYDAPGARVLVSAPLCGVFGFTSAMAALAGRAPLVMYPAFDPAQSAGAIRRHQVTHTNASDEMIGRMLDTVPDTPAFPSARFFGYAAFSPAFADLPQRAATRGLNVVGLYGSSELHALLARQSETAPVPERWLAGGRFVAPEAVVRARDPESNAILPHGRPGELEFRAPSLMAGYFGDAVATRAALTEDGFFRSGDLGHSTADGAFVFLARLGDALRLGGFLVGPAEIEAVLQEHPSVAAAQAVGIETGAGLRAFAFVIPAAGATFDEPALRAHCAARLAKFKVPLRIAAIDAFPVTPGANATKIQKGKLRELAQQALAGGGADA